jgi:hypothetical protein
MQVELSAQQRESRNRFRRFTQDRIAPHAGEWDNEQRVPPHVIDELREHGFLGAPVDRQFGGSSMDAITYGLMTEELGRACSSIRSLLTVHDMVTLTVQRWGKPCIKEKFVSRMARGELIGALALSEPNVGSDSSSVETEARAESDHYVLNGRKSWITFGQIADVFLVVAREPAGISAFLVPADTPGLARNKIQVVGTRASLVAGLDLRDCRVPKEFMVGKSGFAHLQAVATALDFGRYSVAWGCVGIAQACLTASLDYCGQRKQFGVTLDKHQLVQRMLSEMITNTHAARLLCCRAGYTRQMGDPQAISETLVAKYFASRAATRAANDAVQLHGANGLTDNYPVSRFLRDAKVMEIIEGSTQIQQIAIVNSPPSEI